HVEFGQCRPGRVEQAGELLCGIGSRIPDPDPEALGEEIGRPTSSDGAGTDAGDRGDRVEVRVGGSGGAIVHRSTPVMVGVGTRRSRISRSSAGLATAAPRVVMMSTAREVRSAFVALTPLDMSRLSSTPTRA